LYFVGKKAYNSRVIAGFSTKVGFAPTFAFMGQDMRSNAQLRAMLQPRVEALGFELVDAELVGSGKQTTLRVYIDSAGGIDVEDCALVSRQLSAVLDVEDPIPGQYTLEVSSPGLDRPLVRREDFERFMGALIKVRMLQPVLGRKNFTGRLVGIEGDHVVVDVDKESYDLPFEAIEKARLVPEL
jgi:ribosome maturation factor RimP